jgi:ubiquinone/menaquinone biosynthesis C-methylase UbiE
MTEKKDYVEVIYNEKDRPFTEYPDKLAKYLVDRFDLTEGKSILDLGCGRGEFLRGFMRCGLKSYGFDQSDAARKICPAAEIKNGNLEEQLPYDDNSFDYIYSKSVIEHFYYPEKLVEEIFRILKPGGLVITMTLDWEVIYKMFYEDYTHRTPFTKTSLRDIFLIHSFKNVNCEQFRQLPFLWKMPWLWTTTSLIALLCPGFLKKSSKLIKFSKEMMLLCSATKPE